MSEKKDFWIILWSTEDITIDNIDLKRSIESEAKDAEVTIVTLNDIKNMNIKNFVSLLETCYEKSALIVSPTNELDSVDFWKLGFVMGKMPFQLKDKKITPLFAYLKGDKNSLFSDISETCHRTVDNPIEIKREMKAVLQELGINSKFDIKDFTYGKNIAGKERESNVS